MTYPAPNFVIPRFLQKDRAETLSFPLYSPQGAAAAVTSAVFTLLDSSGGTVVTGPATITAGVPSFNLASTFADDHVLPQSAWRERWEMTGVSGGPSGVLTLEHEAFVCRVAPAMVINAESLFKMHSAWRRQLPQSRTSYDEPIVQAWEELIARLIGEAHLPSKVLNWWAIGVVHKYWAAHIVCNDFQTDNPNDSRWARLSEQYWKRSQDEYEKHLGLRKDTNEDGVADHPNKLEGTAPQLYLSEIPGWPFGWEGR